MTETSTPVIPATGPATLGAVKLQAGIDDTDTRDDDRLLGIVDAVNAVIRRPIPYVLNGGVLLVADEWVWGGDVQLGANMLGARLFKRKNSPAGVEAFTADGAAYVMRNDPDIAMLLKLGDWSRPVAR